MPRRWLALLASFGALVLVFQTLVRPWYLRWGATDAETRRPLPGDEILGREAIGQLTRAITIAAPVEQVWPWLAQLGQDRGGFYSYDLLENLVGCELPTEDRLRPEQQAWRLGDRLWMYPPDKAHGVGFATLRSYLPGRVLGFGTRSIGTPLTAPEDGSWTFVLEPTAGATRLLIRGRGAPGRTWLGRAFDRAIFEPAHFAMERRMMLGIKALAEGRGRSRTANHLLVGLWAITFGLVGWSAVWVVRGRRWRRSLAAFVAAGGVFQILTFTQPGVIPGALLVTAVAALLAPRDLQRPAGRRERRLAGPLAAPGTV